MKKIGRIRNYITIFANDNDYKMKLKSSILFLLLVTSQLLFSQVEFTANVSKKKLGINERLRVDFEMNSEGDNFSPPAFTGFTVVGGPSQSVSHSWINGKRSFSKTYTYILSPKKRGKFTIKQAEIVIEGLVKLKEYFSTSPLPVKSLIPVVMFAV